MKHMEKKNKFEKENAVEQSAKKFDILIIGGGVAGMSAAIYAKRRRKNVAILERMALGGQVNEIPKIENFPSVSSIDGQSLAQQFSKQIEYLGVDVIYDDIQRVDYDHPEKRIFGKNAEYVAKSVIIATGVSYVELGKNEKDFLGKGASFCAVCDANFFKGVEVCVASKNGSGLKDALFLTELCSKVTVLDSEDMVAYAQANKNKKLEVISNVNIEQLLGEDILSGVQVSIRDKKKESQMTAESGKNKEMVFSVEYRVVPTSALFIELGKKPDGKVFGGVKVDEKGFVVTDENMRTSIDGVFAVGDVRSKMLKQIVTACSDGAIAGQQA